MEQNTRRDFLRELARAGDDTNMWRAGEALGMIKDHTETLSLDLLSEGLLEMVNLSGGVRLTPEGQNALGEPAPPDQPADLALLLKALEEAGDLDLAPQAAADLSADLATLKAQLKRSQPLNAVIKACLSAVSAALQQSPSDEARRLAQWTAKFSE